MSSAVIPGKSMRSKKKNSNQRPRACDSCRLKRIRCEHDGTIENPCNACAEVGIECTFVQAAPKKVERGKVYLEMLEKRVAMMEALLAKYEADAALVDQLQGTDEGVLEMSSDSYAPSLPTSILGTGLSTTSTFQDSWDGSALVPAKSTIGASAYWGKSGMTGLLGAMSRLLKEKWNDVTVQVSSLTPPMPWQDCSFVVMPNEFEFPPSETIATLVDIYFTHINIYWPLLCRPLVERDIAECKYFFDPAFGRTLFLICALAARYSHHLGAYSFPDQPRSCGWHWFHRAQSMQPMVTQAPTLSDIHFYALSGLFTFLFGSVEIMAGSTFIPAGIRVLQVLGAHRKHAYTRPLSVIDELWKRAFWVLVALDRTINTFRGLSCSIQDESLDVDFPLECDDEYWDLDNAEHAVRQPENTPSRMSYFCAYLRLLQIDAVASRTLYSLNRSRHLFGISEEQWQQKIATELDSALDRWSNTVVPHHLRWDASRPPGIFRDLSMALHVSYLYTRISIHQPFILVPSPFPSLAICTHAAQEYILLVQDAPVTSLVIQNRLAAHLFSSALVMLANVMSGDHSPALVTQLELAVGQCIKVLGSFQDLPLAHAAWRTLDIIFSVVRPRMIVADDIPLMECHSSPV